MTNQEAFNFGWYFAQGALWYVGVLVLELMFSLVIGSALVWLGQKFWEYLES